MKFHCCAVQTCAHCTGSAVGALPMAHLRTKEKLTGYMIKVFLGFASLHQGVINSLMKLNFLRFEIVMFKLTLTHSVDVLVCYYYHIPALVSD